MLNPQKGRPSSVHSIQNKYAGNNNLFSRGLKRVPLSKTSQLNYFSSSCFCVGMNENANANLLQRSHSKRYIYSFSNSDKLTSFKCENRKRHFEYISNNALSLVIY